MKTGREKVRSEIQRVLGALTSEEQRLLSAVIKIEDEQIHLARPRVTQDIEERVRSLIS